MHTGYSHLEQVVIGEPQLWVSDGVIDGLRGEVNHTLTNEAVEGRVRLFLAQHQNILLKTNEPGEKEVSLQLLYRENVLFICKGRKEFCLMS